MLTKNTWLLGLITILLLGLVACSQPATNAESSSLEEAIPAVQEPIESLAEPVVADQPAVALAENPVTEMDQVQELVVETAVLPATSLATLTDAEIEALQFMREEEKLARDVYLVMYDLWGLPIFQNIASSEQIHTDTVLSLLQRYGLADPAAGLGPGEFANADLQALYDQLIDMGSQSIEDALLVGALVEETDIADLESRLAAIQNAEIIQAFNNLHQGSQSHLRSYVGMWEQQTGETYQPTILDAAFANILAGTNGNGPGGQNQGGTQGQGNGRGRGSNGQGGQGQGGNGQGQGGNG